MNTTVRPRLLVLASTFPANADDTAPAFVRDLAAYESNDFDTTVLVPAVPGGLARERIGSVEVRRFRFFPRRWEDLAAGAIIENVRQRKSRLLQVPTFLVAEVLAVRRLVRELKPDVLHVHWIIPQGIAAMLGARRTPMLITTLGGDLYAMKGPISRKVIAAVLRRCAAVTTMNEEMRQRLIDLGADPQRTYVLPMGADTARIQASAEGVVRVPGRLLFAARIVEKKGLAVLLDALPLLAALSTAEPTESTDGRPVGAPVELHVVGDGPLREQLAERAVGLPVRFLGSLSREELAREYGAAVLVVFPSLPAASGDQDGLPVALLEAMAAGSAVIASDMPGLREAVVDGRSGVLVKPGDDECARLRQGARGRAERYSVTSIGTRYLNLLDDIRSGRQPRSAERLEHDHAG
jgi:glycosyltransferase involved in cell wall biosynthesis